MIKFISSISPTDKVALVAGNGATAVLAVFFSESGPAWITAVATGFYLACKGIAELRRSRITKRESRIDSEKDL